MHRPRGQGVALGRVTVDLGAERVLDREGRPVALRPQAFAVLRYLLENPRRLVTKDELMQAVWPGVAVTDDSLVQCVGEIRRVLGDEDRSLVETVPRRGYRLVPASVPEEVAAPPRRFGRAALLAVLLVVLAIEVWRML